MLALDTLSAARLPLLECVVREVLRLHPPQGVPATVSPAPGAVPAAREAERMHASTRAECRTKAGVQACPHVIWVGNPSQNACTPAPLHVVSRSYTLFVPHSVTDRAPPSLATATAPAPAAGSPVCTTPVWPCAAGILCCAVLWAHAGAAPAGGGAPGPWPRAAAQGRTRGSGRARHAAQPQPVARPSQASTPSTAQRGANREAGPARSSMHLHAPHCRRAALMVLAHVSCLRPSLSLSLRCGTTA